MREVDRGYQGSDKTSTGTFLMTSRGCSATGVLLEGGLRPR